MITTRSQFEMMEQMRQEMARLRSDRKALRHALAAILNIKTSPESGSVIFWRAEKALRETATD